MTAGPADTGDNETLAAPSSGRVPASTRVDYELAPGTLVNEKYRVVRRLGAGGMGTVYLAEHLGLRTSVALKLLLPHLLHNRDYARRFEREARATYKLQHPHIVRVIDFGKQPNLYIAMEFIEGRTLEEHLRSCDEPPPLDFVYAVMDQLLDALEAAHQGHIVHRDLKPDNVLLSFGGGHGPNIKVLDFGLARFDDVADRGPTLTQHDIVAGTPAYMSPEQCRSLAVGPPTDLYAIGCMLTELLQLKPPFEASSPAVLMSQQMFVPAPALSRPAHSEPVPAGLERLRLALLEKHAHARPASAADARALLHAAHANSETSLRPSRTPAHPRGGLTSRSDPPAALATRTLTLRVVGGTSDGVSDACRIGLSTNGVHFDEDAPLVIVDEDATLEVRCQRVRALIGERPGAQVLVCCDTSDALAIRSLVEAGAADVLVYPLAPHELIKRLRRVERRRAGE